MAATRAAVEEGIVSGGGTAYIRAISALEKLKGANEDENTGIAIVKRAIEEPLRQICANCGIEGSIVVQKVKEGKDDFGYNARTDVYENMLAAGVIDPYHRVYHYPSLHVVDGSTITANLGVNPSLTITAQAERAFAMWPNKGETDIRPTQNEIYRKICAIAPIAPVVPRGAIGELRIVEVK